jgi:hypothetical protein
MPMRLTMHEAEIAAGCEQTQSRTRVEEADPGGET